MKPSIVIRWRSSEIECDSVSEVSKVLEYIAEADAKASKLFLGLMRECDELRKLGAKP